MSRLQDHKISAVEPPAFVGRLFSLLSAACAATLAWQLFRPIPLIFAGLSIDRLSAAAGLFVAVVGGVVCRFATRSMEGHPDRSRFVALLGFCGCMAFLLTCASNLLLLAVAWVLLGAGVHQLLLSGGRTRSAWLATRRKFVMARMGEAALIVAVLLLWWRTGSLEIGACLEATRRMSAETLMPVALLLALAATVRSVQVPFHAWLPDTMDAPTPVSALLHAGIVNAGGMLLIRFAPLVVRVPEAWLMLSVFGTVTMLIGSLAMAQQVRLKQTLAWSTVAQMGFMTVQCAVAAFPAALLHLVGHGAYKAMAFLRCGETPAVARRLGPAWWNLVLLAAGTGSAVPSLWLAERLTGFDPRQAPGETALAIVIALGVGQSWIASLSACRWRLVSIARGGAVAIAASIVFPSVCFAAYRGAAWFLEPVLGGLEQPRGLAAVVAATLPVVAILTLSLAHAAQPWLQRSRGWRSLQVQARSGFHIGRIIDRSLDAILTPNPKSETRHA